jgi:hypothetical protein
MSAKETTHSRGEFALALPGGQISDFAVEPLPQNIFP